jgi:succinate dehydrogenase hydrophobic anchor subunit
MNSKNDNGISVKEIEEYAKKNKFPVALALAILLACLFSVFLSMTKFCIILLTLAALTGIFIPGKVAYIAKKLYSFIGKQDKTIQVVIGSVFLVIAIFFPPAIFLLLGLHAGKDMRHVMMEQTHPTD